MISREFIPYAEALDLKELGFNEPCLGFYAIGSDKPCGGNYPCYGEGSAPLYQQAFRWFREKYNIKHSIGIDYDTYFWDIYVPNHTDETSLSPKNFETYEDALLACLRRIIEIVKENG